MIGLTAYKILHLAGVVGLFGALGAAAANAGQAQAGVGDAWRRSIRVLHGVSLLVILVAGFGMLARLGEGFPGWAMAKVVLWFVMGALVAVPYRSPGRARLVLWSLPLLGALAAWLALAKPF